MKKNLIIIVSMMIICMMFFSSCTPSTTSTEESIEVQAQEEVAEESTSETKSEVVLPEEITIGATLPLSGEGAPYGTIMLNGLQLGIDKINEEGGVQGVKINLVALDDRADPEEAVTTMQRLVQVDKAIYISTAYSAPPLAQAPIADETKTVIINGGGFAPELRGAGKYLLNNVPLSTDEGRVILTYAFNDLNITNLGIIVASSYSKETLDFMDDYWTGMGGKVSLIVKHDAGASDLRSQIELLKGSDAEAVLLLNDGDDTLLTLTQAEQVDYKPQWLGFAGQMISQILSLPSADGMVASSVVYEPDTEFVDAYTAEYDEEPNFYVAQYYDHSVILKDALEYIIENSMEFTGESLREAIYSIRTFEGVNGSFSFQDDGTVYRTMSVVKVTNGAQETIKTISVEEQMN